MDDIKDDANALGDLLFAPFVIIGIVVVVALGLYCLV